MEGKVLVVDDEVAMRDMIASFLTIQGIYFDTADGIKTARDMLRSNSYDLMLLDKNMPGDNGSQEAGIDLLREIRSNGISCEVIIMTGRATAETALAAIKLGAFDYILKPFSLNYLLQKINRAMEFKRSVKSVYSVALYRKVREEIVNILEKRYLYEKNKAAQVSGSFDSNNDIQSILNIYEDIMRLQKQAIAENSIAPMDGKSNTPECLSMLSLLGKIISQV